MLTSFCFVCCVCVKVELYTAVSDPQQRTLYRASALADRFGCATNKVGMYLARRRHVQDGIFQATTFLQKPTGRSGLKAGGYFLSLEVQTRTLLDCDFRCCLSLFSSFSFSFFSGYFVFVFLLCGCVLMGAVCALCGVKACQGFEAHFNEQSRKRGKPASASGAGAGSPPPPAPTSLSPPTHNVLTGSDARRRTAPNAPTAAAAAPPLSLSTASVMPMTLPTSFLPQQQVQALVQAQAQAQAQVQAHAQAQAQAQVQAAQAQTALLQQLLAMQYHQAAAAAAAAAAPRPQPSPFGGAGFGIDPQLTAALTSNPYLLNALLASQAPAPPPPPPPPSAAAAAPALEQLYALFDRRMHPQPQAPAAAPLNPFASQPQPSYIQSQINPASASPALQSLSHALLYALSNPPQQPPQPQLQPQPQPQAAAAQQLLRNPSDT